MSIEDLFRLDGRVALITGASKNIGRATAHLLADAGADLILAARGRGALDDVAASVRDATGRTVHVFPADLADSESRQRLIADVLEGVGRVDVLVNNAYMGASSTPVALVDQPEDLWDINLQVNLIAPYELIRAFAPGMRARGKGSIINMLASAAFTPAFGQGPYACAKAALGHLTKCFALELAPEVRVNSVVPSNVTETGEILWAQQRDLLRLVPLGRMGVASEVAPTILYLVSDASGYTTGQSVFVDGGRTRVGTVGLPVS